MKRIIGIMISMCLLIGLLGGCGNESNINDTTSESTIKGESQTEESQSKDVTVETQTSTESATQESTDSQESAESATQKPADSQEPSESESQKPIDSQKPLESETQKPTDSQKPSDSESQKPIDSQKPTESESQKPSDSQKPTEFESQKPSDSQKPSESESQEPETQETETQEPEVHYEEYKLSTQTYDYALQVSEKYYLVGQEDYYGIVDFSGNIIVPIEYDSYKMVAENEIEFEDGGEEFYVENIGWLERRNAYVYSADTGKLLLQYVSSEMTAWVDKHRETIVCGAKEHEILYADPESDPLGCFEGDTSIERKYQNGLLMESYPVFDCCETYEKGVLLRNYVSFTNVKTGELIYEGYSAHEEFEYYYEVDGEWYEEYQDGAPQIFRFSSNKSEAKAVMFEDSIQEDQFYLVFISPDGYEKYEFDVVYMLESSVDYSNDWMKMPYSGKMINTKTMEIIDMPSEAPSAAYWYYGIGEYYGLSDVNDDTIYNIYKGTKKIATNYKKLYFSTYYIIGKRADGKFAFIDYDGKEQLVVNDYSDPINGKYLINDGVGVYYVDKTLQRVSDYIYEGVVENCHAGAILLGEKYYLIGKQ